MEPQEEVARGSNEISSQLQKCLAEMYATVVFQCKLSERQAITDGSGSLVTGAVKVGESCYYTATCTFFIHLFE